MSTTKRDQHDLAPGIQITVILSSTTLLFIFTYTLWKFLRSRSRPELQRSQDLENQSSSTALVSRPSPQSQSKFPSNPAVRPLTYQSSATPIVVSYDPRTETAFPNTPVPGQPFSLRSGMTRPASVRDAEIKLWRNNLFVPRQSDVTNGWYRGEERCFVPPRAATESRGDIRSGDYGDAKDFILAIPEPLLLKPRPAGRPPAVARYQQRHGTPSSCPSDRILHPNKLFQNISNGDNRFSVCSGTSLAICHKEVESNAQEMMEMVEQAMSADKRESLAHESEIEKEGSRPSTASTRMSNGTRSLTALHRLRSYKSLTKNAYPKLTRAGTISRSKTPVEHMVRMYENEEHKMGLSEINIPQDSTSSILFRSPTTRSGRSSPSTPQTSPRVEVNTLLMLPTPLRPRLNTMRNNMRNNMKEQNKAQCGKHSVARLKKPLSPNRDSPPQQAYNNLQVRRRRQRASKGFYHANQQARTPLVLKPSTRNTHDTVTKNEPALAVVPGDLTLPPARDDKLCHRPRASSMYSRDTQGFSMIRSPISPDFPSAITEILGDSNTTWPAVYLKRSPESVKAHVDEWTKRIESLPTTSMSKSEQIVPESHDQSISLNWAWGNCQNVSDSERIQKENNVPRNTAPGGAEWI